MATVEDTTGGGAGSNASADVDKRVVVIKVYAATEVGEEAGADVVIAAKVTESALLMLM